MVDDLYSYRDQFFECHQIEEAEEKPKLLKDKLNECLQSLDRLSCKFWDFKNDKVEKFGLFKYGCTVTALNNN